ncbi:MAG TPA: M23 family metallopeptidase [Longimicrobiales bacterium]|nr:M23 family metallopeptidase [Longimicrobiales bacterium]
MRRCLAAPATLVVLLVVTGCSVPRWPVGGGTMTSPFGLRRDGLGLTIHRGVDISLPPGTEVHAMAPGTVVFAGTMNGYGHAVVLDHGHGVRTLYAHLSEIHVESGQEIATRTVIARSGSSGRTTGPHLHFEILRRGRAEDPVPLLGGFPPPAR